jgi:HPt (histidine-containing phosphotransfer) domain-containing protein
MIGEILTLAGQASLGIYSLVKTAMNAKQEAQEKIKERLTHWVHELETEMLSIDREIAENDKNADAALKAPL